MKRFLPMLLVLSLPVLAHAGGQATAEEFLARIPPQPMDACSVGSPSPRGEFGRQVGAADVGVFYKEITRRKKKIKKSEGAMSKQMMANAVDLPGFEGYDQAQIKKMTKKEKKEMAEKMMEQKYGMNKQELKDLKKLDTEGRKGWAEGVAREQQVAESIDPEKANAERKGNKEILELVQQQQDLSRGLFEEVKLYQDRVREAEEDPDGVKLRKEIEMAEKVEGGDCGAQKRIYDMKVSYCNLLSPRHIEALRDYRGMLGNSLGKYKRMDQLNQEIMKKRGADLPDDAIGLSGLEAVRDYFDALKTTFKYRLYESSVECGS